MSVRKLMCVVGIVALTLAAALPAFAQWPETVSGYTQFRFNYDDADDDEDFDVRRARLKWSDTINEQGTEATLQIDLAKLVNGGGEVGIKDLKVVHPFGETWSVRVGFASTPFGFEVPYSSRKRLPFERSKAARSFFPGERDLGVYLNWMAPSKTPVELNLGYTNGMDDWREDDDDASAVVARVQVPFGNDSVVGASYMAANREGSVDGLDYDVDPDVFGLHARYNGQAGEAGYAIQGEYYDGDLLDGGMLWDANGWYGQVEYTPANSLTTVFYRYDEFEATFDGVRASQEGSYSTENYERHTIGVAWDFLPNNRLTFQIEDVDDGESFTDWGLQWQIRYK